MKKHTLKSIAILGTLASSMALSQGVLAEEVDTSVNEPVAGQPAEESLTATKNTTTTTTTNIDNTTEKNEEQTTPSDSTENLEPTFHNYPEEYYANKNEEYLNPVNQLEYQPTEEERVFYSAAPSLESMRIIESVDPNSHNSLITLLHVPKTLKNVIISQGYAGSANFSLDNADIFTYSKGEVDEFDNEETVKYLNSGISGGVYRLIVSEGNASHLITVKDESIKLANLMNDYAKSKNLKPFFSEQWIENLKNLDTRPLRAITVETNYIGPTGTIEKTETTTHRPDEYIPIVYKKGYDHTLVYNLTDHKGKRVQINAWHMDKKEYLSVEEAFRTKLKDIASDDIINKYTIALENGLGDIGFRAAEALRGEKVIINYVKGNPEYVTDHYPYDQNGIPWGKEMLVKEYLKSGSTTDSNANTPTVDTTKPTDGVVADNNGSTDNTAVNKPNTDVKPSTDNTTPSDKQDDKSDTPKAPQGSASTPSAPAVAVATPTAQGQALPATGESDTFAVFSLSALAILASVGLIAPVVRRREQ